MCDFEREEIGQEHKERMRRNSVDFFFFLYFGVSIDDIEGLDDIIDMALKEAYRNATLMGAYNTQIHEDMRGVSDQAHADAMERLPGWIKDLLGSGERYDEEHERICGELYEVYNNETRSITCFTFGNAQKWVNMTMKYLYMICGAISASGAEDDTDKGKRLKKIIDDVLGEAVHFHVPVDSYVLEAWKGGLEFLRENGRIDEDEVFIVQKYTNSFRIKYDVAGGADGAVGFVLSSDGHHESTWSGVNDYGVYKALWKSETRKTSETERAGSLNMVMSENAEDGEWPIEWESRTWIRIGITRRKR